MTLTLISVNCGVPHIIGERDGRPVLSAIGKTPVAVGRVFFGALGIFGDEQANRSVHGGPDQAVCAYSADHWSWWRSEKRLHCESGTFGENLTVSGADENSVGIGDRFVWDEVILEVTQPRGPCANVDLRHRRDDLAQTMTLTVRCGWYMRVIREGLADANNTTLEQITACDRPSVRDAFLARHDSRAPLSLRRRVHDCPALASHWRRRIACTLS